MRVCFYLEDFHDEVMPCDCSLDGWAQWLSEPSEEWNRPEGAKDGDTFDAERAEITYHEVSRLDDGALKFDPPLPAKFDILAPAYCEGGGWDPDMICNEVGELEAIEPLEVGEIVAALVTDSIPHKVTFRTNPMRCESAPAAA